MAYLLPQIIDMISTEKVRIKVFLEFGAHHQNVRAERSMQTIIYMARTFMVHTSLNWSDRGSNFLSLWYFPAKHSVWFYNQLPRK